MANNYYIDTEFIEGTQKSLFGKTKPTIDIISIGIVSDDNRKFYAVSKDFNLKEAWYRWEQRTGQGDRNNIEPRHYWIREKVLKPIFDDWKSELNGKIVRLGLQMPLNEMKFTYRNFKYCIKCIGKSNEEIAKKVKDFINNQKVETIGVGTVELTEQSKINITRGYLEPKFYGYYADYDWVAFCWLFGKMIDLPIGFPMYCIDLKQESDRIYNLKKEEYTKGGGKNFLNTLSDHYEYPRQTNEHHALKDAEWNKRLHEFLQTL